jgi:hypothetical protein
VTKPVPIHSDHQGQLQLKRYPGKDFQHERFAPAAGSASHGDTVFAQMLL